MAVMTRFLRGVCESNLWGFMENINLLTRSVMSVISSHFQTIKTAQTIHLREFTLDQQTTRMFPGVAFLCTENIVQVLQLSLTHTKLLTGLGLSEEDSSLVAHSLQKDLGAASSHGNSALRDSQVNFASPTSSSHFLFTQGEISEEASYDVKKPCPVCDQHLQVAHQSRSQQSKHLQARHETKCLVIY